MRIRDVRLPVAVEPFSGKSESVQGLPNEVNIKFDKNYRKLQRHRQGSMEMGKGSLHNR